MADRIILNKIDLVSEEQLSQVELKIRSINGSADILKTTNSNVPVDFIMNLHCFDGQQSDPFISFNNIPHQVDTAVCTVSFTIPGSISRFKLEEWLRSILWENEQNGDEFIILRLKGLVSFQGDPNKYVLNAVREIYDIVKGSEWRSADQNNKIVIIGKNLDFDTLRNTFLAAQY